MRITGGTVGGIPLAAPRGAKLRPTSGKVRSALFQLVGAAVEGARVLDLYAGTGALGIEALSRGAAFADFVEQDARLCQAIGQNLERAGFQPRGHVHRARVEQALRFLEGAYHLALLDPPYGMVGVPEVLAKLSRPGFLQEGAIVVLEHSSRDAVAERYGSLEMKNQRKYGDTSVSLFTFNSSGEGK